MAAYVVSRRDPRRIATAVVLYQLQQPRFALGLLGALAVFAAAGAFSGASGALAGVVIALVVIVLVTEYKRRQLALQLARRGYRPGSTVEASADELELTVTAATGSGRHPWAEIEHVRVVNGIVLFRMRAARFVVAVPMAAMPDGWAERMSR